MKFFLEQKHGAKELSPEELKEVFDNLDEQFESWSEVLEVYDIDDEGNIYFTITKYSWY